jgi:hypothetical protein
MKLIRGAVDDAEPSFSVLARPAAGDCQLTAVAASPFTVL